MTDYPMGNYHSSVLFAYYSPKPATTTARPDNAISFGWAAREEDPVTTKKILVTGGAGFLGSHLCDRLIELGHEVVCLDNFFTGSRENVQHLMAHPRFELMRWDVNEPTVLDVDEVYHMACPASPIHYQRNPVRTIRTCVLGTLNMLQLSRDVHAKLLIASTSEVYGDPQVHPQPEAYWGNVNPIGTRACYDEGKRCAEA
jgi:UDP-glucuronate decarboxylase